jgi:hypothetical protein
MAIATLVSLVGVSRVIIGIGTGFTGRRAMGQKPLRWQDMPRMVGDIRRLVANIQSTGEFVARAASMRFSNTSSLPTTRKASDAAAARRASPVVNSTLLTGPRIAQRQSRECDERIVPLFRSLVEPTHDYCNQLLNTNALWRARAAHLITIWVQSRPTDKLATARTIPAHIPWRKTFSTFSARWPPSLTNLTRLLHPVRW